MGAENKKPSVSEQENQERVNKQIAGNKALLRSAFQSQSAKDLEVVVNEINAYKGVLKDLTLPDIEEVGAFQKSQFYKEYHKKAEQALLEGRYLAECFFAGAATRLGEGSMWNLSLWKLAKKLDPELNIPAYAREDLKLGERQILELKNSLAILAEKNNVLVKKVLDKQKIILHINEEVEKDMFRDLMQNNFYEFNRENIVIIVQPLLPLYAIDKNGNAAIAESHDKFPYGHGYATEQLIKQGNGYIINSDNEREYIKEEAVSFFKNKGAKYVATHRINDLTRLVRGQEVNGTRYSVVDIDKLALSIYLMDRGKNVIVESVENTAGQKGGLFLKDKKTGRNFLLEGLNAKTDGISARLDELNARSYKETGMYIPYNAFRLIYDIDALFGLLKELPNSIRTRKDKAGRTLIHLELITGDVTQQQEAKVAGIIKAGERIHDFKKKEDAAEAVEFIKVQDFNNK